MRWKTAPRSKPAGSSPRGRGTQASSQVFWDLVGLRVAKAAGMMFTEKPGSLPGKSLLLEHGPCPPNLNSFK